MSAEPVGLPVASTNETARLGPISWVMTRLIDLYRLTSPARTPRCRFHPSCSTYGRQAIVAHGPLKGLYLTSRRLLRCHPWNPGGVDHVPPKA